MAARAIWKAKLQIKQQTIAVKLYSAVQDRDVHFHLLHDQDKVRVKQRLVNPATGETVEYADARRGAEVEPGRFVLLAKEELETLEPKAAHEITISRFVKTSHVPFAWYERPYYLGPDAGATSDYFSLAEALQKQEAMGVAHWVMRNIEYVGALRAESGYLVLITLRHSNEIISDSQLDPPAGRDLNPKERYLAEQLLEALEQPFDPSEYHDEYQERVAELIETKRKGGKIRKRRYRSKATKQPLLKSLEASLKTAVKGKPHAK